MLAFNNFTNHLYSYLLEPHDRRGFSEWLITFVGVSFTANTQPVQNDSTTEHLRMLTFF